MTLVRIAGLMRSGTNLLTWMLRQNFAGVGTATMLLGWKHGPIYRDRAVLGVDEYVDPRYRDAIRGFVRDHPAEWARVTSSPMYAAAAAAQRDHSFAVALAVRNPALWYASCVRIHRERPAFLLHDVSPAAAAAFWNDAHRDWLSALGERGVIVDTDGLRRNPEPVLARMAAALRIERLPGVRQPVGYLHPRGTEEVYELLGAPIVPELAREFTTSDAVDVTQLAEFMAMLDRGVLARLGFVD